MNSSSSSRVRGDVKLSNQQSPTPKVAILKFLRLVAEDTNLESQLTQVCVLHEFQLREEATIYGLDGKTEDNTNFLYSVCQGRVQLILSNVTIKPEALTHLLLEVLAVRASLSKLDSYYNPWIANWQEIHYPVVWRVKGDRTLSNPAIGEASWTGYVLLLDLTENLNALKDEKLSLCHYWRTLWHYRKSLREIILASFSRALIKNTAILILDKATSTLDSDLGHQFQQNVV
ncbi:MULTISPECIES: hypothetical protein [Nostoc]|uniref:Uncharacterized protein n=2 Tax=Nostoc TaxID=1177 RepID=A0ABR8I6C2_9NOSO|nr:MULTISPECIES: hypothetical protein [Nostoc]MBD2561289.1 hypothetical protein [Nostoc linckia FACHB-391]MBD2646429.1 hypothetical protein [Nostoc foliaceum FACHB-393]